MKKIRIGLVVACVLVSGVCFAVPAPNYQWWYGCSPTSAGMMIGYYDINGYGGFQYPNLVPGGVAEMNSFANPGALVNGTIAGPQHVADFYPGGNNASGDDLPPPHHAFNCLADFMGTSQDSVGNSNGWTLFHYSVDGSPYRAKDALADGNWASDGMYGIGEYVEYAGYTYANKGLANEMLYTQSTDPYNNLQFRFTFADFMSEINAGRPVLVQLGEHTMLGYNYIDGGGVGPNQILVYDTWVDDDAGGPHTDGQNPGIMNWNGIYGGMQMVGVTVLELAPIPEPATLTLAALGFAVLVWRRRRK